MGGRGEGVGHVPCGASATITCDAAIMCVAAAVDKHHPHSAAPAALPAAEGRGTDTATGIQQVVPTTAALPDVVPGTVAAPYPPAATSAAPATTAMAVSMVRGCGGRGCCERSHRASLGLVGNYLIGGVTCVLVVPPCCGVLVWRPSCVPSGKPVGRAVV